MSNWRWNFASARSQRAALRGGSCAFPSGWIATLIIENVPEEAISHERVA